MSKKIAVIACLFPLLFSLMLSTFSPVKASASYSYVGQDIRDYCTQEVHEDLFLDLQSMLDTTDQYFYYECCTQCTASRFRVVAFYLHYTSYSVDDSGIYTFSGVSRQGVSYTGSFTCSSYVVSGIDTLSENLSTSNTITLKFDSINNRVYTGSQWLSVPSFPHLAVKSDLSELNPNALDVDVTFSPELSGNVDRYYNHEVTASYSGEIISYGANFNMTVENNSRKAIQYKMAIYKKNQTNLRGSDLDYSHTYDDDPVFMYYSTSWVYSGSIDNQADWLNSIPQKMNKASPYHYLDSGDSETITFKYSQIPLTQGVEYTLIVTACLTDYDSASEIFSSLVYDDQIYTDLYQLDLDSIETVYSSDFVMTRYDDVKYDPTDSSNGVLPFSGMSSYDEYNWSYNAKENSDGSIDYQGKDLLSDSSSWISQQRDNFYNSSSRSSTGSANISGISSNISTFFSFLNTSFSYFPSAWIQLISLGIISLLVLGIIKAVIK